jgi:hypothetical protein
MTKEEKRPHSSTTDVAVAYLKQLRGSPTLVGIEDKGVAEKVGKVAGPSWCAERRRVLLRDVEEGAHGLHVEQRRLCLRQL